MACPAQTRAASTAPFLFDNTLPPDQLFKDCGHFAWQRSDEDGNDAGMLTDNPNR